jgi:hypothetical protein
MSTTTPIRSTPVERETSIARGRRLRDVATRRRLDEVAAMQVALFEALTIGDAENASRARVALERLHADDAASARGWGRLGRRRRGAPTGSLRVW